ncbi:hypothetical protein [Rhizobium tubonense]|uniref:Uncharacterized protein n=1 Tax=Rhizobium tubonense TaxID=484088 RepID=A0A2W4EM95_9HYPH|nr:hypothetical protein [Rhizobium tubonense]PZM14836.1 hypothetical protein CPY51_09000 [Rhizobium tubonense]
MVAGEVIKVAPKHANLRMQLEPWATRMREKKFHETEAIAQTIRQTALPGMKPKALIEAVRKRHPEASKKEIARAAFLCVILSADYDPEDTQALHDLAMDTRDSPES